ncbi:hypothetical protein [Yersinia enterocolitica]|uniref:hypothetical protein n=1 Tax=Yersinia enterocolitica TaxID=630 RepID=UPI001C60AD23|nr:hypothetical protein [Yersinia enterocolitica]MBW5823178.1 hypothetical protein [Yersinia enterocolitica]MBW5853216.1 hypothetical protein [Yersinia enterocolitica]MBW5879277.1 hypothetical protein [Yersinia enterocolitica]
MSQLSELLDKKKIECLPATLDAIELVVHELVNILTPEQRIKLNEAILSKCPSAKNATGKNANTVAYQLSLFIDKRTGSSD